MKTILKVFFLTLSLCVSAGPSPKAEQSKDVGCSMIEGALKDYQQLKSVTTRRDVEKYFRPGGGLQFPAKMRYVYPKCDYLHVDVEFELAKPAQIASLPEDKVIGVSKLYVEYPATD